MKQPKVMIGALAVLTLALGACGSHHSATKPVSVVPIAHVAKPTTSTTKAKPVVPVSKPVYHVDPPVIPPPTTVPCGCNSGGKS